MIGMSNIPSFIATTESERAARENRERAAIEAVAGPGPHHAGLSNERQTAESRSSYRAGYDQITWTVDQLAAAEKELEKWRAKEAVRKSAAYFASLGAAPYAAGFDPRSPMKAGPAVLIGGQWWRPSEMGTVFEVSLDGLNGWQECVGEIGGRGDVASRLARLEAALASNRGKISDDVAAVLKEQIATVEQQGQFLAKLSDEVDTMKEQVAALSRRDELTKEIRQIDAGLNSAAAEEKSPAGNSAPTPKANSGAKPPERR